MHLSYRCHKIKYVLDELKHIFNIIFEKNIVLVEENLIIGVYEGEITENLLLGNYSYYWIHYEFSCINNSFHCLLCKNVCL